MLYIGEMGAMSSECWILYYLLWSLPVLALLIDACDYQSRPSHCLVESRLYKHADKCPGFSNHPVCILVLWYTVSLLCVFTDEILVGLWTVELTGDV